MDTRPAPRRIAVVGGGAAGVFAAMNIAAKAPKTRITILEAGHKPLQKVFISGGGRCNVTHHCFDPARLVEHYPRGAKALRGLFSRFQPRDMTIWLETHGLSLKTEADGRIFPVSDRSQDVIDCFLNEAEQRGITLRTRCRVASIAKNEAGRFVIQINGQAETFDAVILATGYSPTGWKLAESLGHTIIPPVPSLFPFKIDAPVIKGLQGISLPNAAGRLSAPAKAGGKPVKIDAEGALLITHTGLSGPLIYRLSAWGARALAESRYQAQLQLDFFPRQTDEALKAQLQRVLVEAEGKKKLANTQFAHLPQRLWLAVLEASGAPLEERGETLGKKALNRLVENLKRLPLTVSGKSPSKEEFVSCGGVPLNEVDFRTMESKRVPGLYFAGEILDIDGLTGGFNFQACWSAAWTLSEAFRQEAP